jgi:hypothetical protein
MAKLTSKQRNALPASDFAGPDRSYPVNDMSHARNALARASQNAGPALKSHIKSLVKKKFPQIKVEGSQPEPRGDRARRK